MNNMDVMEVMHFSWAIKENDDIFVELRKRFQKGDYHVFS